MKRYQIYLDQQDVQVLDAFSSATQVSRSQLIRDGIEVLARQLGKLLVEKKQLPTKKSQLDRMIGSFQTPNTKITNFATKSDREYL